MYMQCENPTIIRPLPFPYSLMQLDLARNRLLTIGTLFALANLCFAFGSMIAGIYGKRAEERRERRACVRVG